MACNSSMTDWMCTLLSKDIDKDTSAFNLSLLVTGLIQENTSAAIYNATLFAENGSHFHNRFAYEAIVMKGIIPGLCVIGFCGNLLTFIILRQRMKEGIDMLERGSIIGMLGL